MKPEEVLVLATESEQSALRAYALVDKNRRGLQDKDLVAHFGRIATAINCIALALWPETWPDTRQKWKADNQ